MLRSRAVYIPAVLLGIALGGGGVFVLTRGAQAPQAAMNAIDGERPRPGARTLAELLELPPGNLAGVDIAEMNVLCAGGLPGAERLDTAGCLATLDAWAEKVRFETERHLYRASDPRYADHYRHSETYLRAEFLLQTLQQQLGVHYNHARIDEIDFTNSKDLFIHGMVDDDNGGTCVSMPVLYVAVGRRLGYPLKLALARAHVYVRWDDPDTGEQFNIEGAGEGFNSYEDAHYMSWPATLSEWELASGYYLRSLTPAEDLALFMTTRAHCLQDTGRYADALVAYAEAHRLAPNDPLALRYLDGAVKRAQLAQRAERHASAEQPATTPQSDQEAQDRE